MFLAIAILVAHALIFPVAAAAFFFQRWRSKRRKRRGHHRFGFYPSAAAAGNALQSLQALMEPQIQHVLEEKLDEPVDEDDSGGPDDPSPTFTAKPGASAAANPSTASASAFRIAAPQTQNSAARKILLSYAALPNRYH